MNTEISQAFLDLYGQMGPKYANHAFVIGREHSTYGDLLDQIRVEIEASGYLPTHQHELNIILNFLTRVDDSKLSEKLQSIIDSLGEPQHT